MIGKVNKIQYQFRHINTIIETVRHNDNDNGHLQIKIRHHVTMEIEICDSYPYRLSNKFIIRIRKCIGFFPISVFEEVPPTHYDPGCGPNKISDRLLHDRKINISTVHFDFQNFNGSTTNSLLYLM